MNAECKQRNLIFNIHPILEQQKYLIKKISDMSVKNELSCSVVLHRHNKQLPAGVTNARKMIHRMRQTVTP